MYFRFVYSCSFKNMNAEMETLSLLLVSTAPRVLWLPYSLYAGYVITGKEEKEEEEEGLGYIDTHTFLSAPASSCCSSRTHHRIQQISVSVMLAGSRSQVIGGI